jgi:hypothetical protein
MKYAGSADFIKGKARYCLWIKTQDVEEAMRVGPIKQRIDRVAIFRSKSTKKATQVQASTPWQFAEVRYKASSSIFVPRVSSERRDYIPIGYLDEGTVTNDQAFAVYDAEPWVFALLTSRMHMVWTRAVGGKLKTDYRYSNTIVYNNFPVPTILDAMKKQLTERALRVLDVREYHSELTLADLYDPDRMPDNLRLAHQSLDELVDSIYRKREFVSDEERLSMLFEMYATMTEAGGNK